VATYDFGFLCQRHGCRLSGRAACADYQQVRPRNCRGCTQPDRARKVSTREYRHTWTANAIEQKSRRKRKLITLAELNEIFDESSDNDVTTEVASDL